MNRTWLRVGLVIVAVIGLLAGGLVFLLATEPGARAAWRMARAVIGTPVSIGKLEGTLMGPLEMRELVYADETQQLNAGHIRLDWDPVQLLSGTLAIQQLVLRDIGYTTLAAGEPVDLAEQLQQLKLPLTVTVREIRAESVDIRAAPDAPPLHLDRVEAGLDLRENSLKLSALSIQGPELALRGSGSLGLEGAVPVASEFGGWVNLDDGTRISGGILLDGTLDRLRMRAITEAPYTADARVEVIDVLTTPGYEFNLSAEDFALEVIAPALTGIRLSGTVMGRKTASADQWSLQTALTATGVQEVGSLRADGLILANADKITTRDLALGIPGQPLQVVLSGNVDLTTDSPTLDLDSTWRNVAWPLQGPPQITGNIRRLDIKGPVQRLSVNLAANIDGPGQTGQVDAVIDLDISGVNPELRVVARGKGLRWPLGEDPFLNDGSAEFNVTGALPTLQGHMRLLLHDRPDAPLVTADAVLDLSNPDGASIDLDGEWTGLQWPVDPPAALVVSRSGVFKVSANAENLSARIDAKFPADGEVTATLAQSGENMEISLDWRRIDWPHLPEPLHSDRGNVRLTGVIEDYGLRARSNMVYGGKPLTLSMDGRGDLSSLTMDRFTLGLMDGEITGPVRVAWDPDVAIEVELDGRKLDPARWWTEWPGRLEAKLNARGGMGEDGFELETAALEMSGILRDHPVRLDARGVWGAGGGRLETLTLESAKSRLQAQGSLGESVSLEWQLTSDDLRALHPQASGVIDASGAVAGTLEKPRITAKIRGNGLGFMDDALEALRLDASIDATDQSTSRLHAEIDRGRVAGVDIDAARLDIEGLIARHEVNLEARTGQGDIQAALTGGLDNTGQWNFEIIRAGIDKAGFGDWALTSPGGGHVATDRGLLSPSCFADGGAKLCVQGEWSAATANGAFELTEFPLGALGPWLPENLVLTGAVNGQGGLNWDATSGLLGDIELRNSGGQLLTAERKSEDAAAERILVFEPGSLKISLRADELDAALELPLAGEDVLRGRGKIGGGADWMRRTLDAEITTRIQDIGFLNQLIPEVEKMSGTLEGTMRAQGTLGDPVYTGRIDWRDGLVELLGPGTVLNDINAQMSGDPLSGMNLTATVRVGDGTGKLEGVINVLQTEPELDIAIQGADLHVMNTSQASVFVSPDLKLSLDSARIRLSGEVRVPRATITLREVPATAVGISPDQILVDETQPEASLPVTRKIEIQVRTVLGDDVNFTGFGLSGRLAGALTTVDRPGEASTAEGEIRVIDGRYQAYGQNLTIETGRLLFSGAVTQPTLDLKAARQPAQGVRVGVVARGTLQRPDFSLFSEPAMTQRNQLSYLLLGRPAETTSTSERNSLGRAALALGLGRTEGITGKISDELGLDQLGVEAEPGATSEQASFVVGKYLTPELYLSYGIGLFEPINTLRLRYALGKHWQMVTESSGETRGGDILYSVEGGE